MPIILNEHDVEIEVTPELLADRRRKGLRSEISPYITVGTGPENRIALLIRNNGLGDDFHAMPAVWQKVRDGYDVHIYGNAWRRRCFESVGATFHDAKHLMAGFIAEHINTYGKIYSLSQWCVTHESETNGNPTIDRLQQFASYIETTLPFKFSWNNALGVSRGMENDTIILAMHTTSLHRSYQRFLELYDLIEEDFSRYRRIKYGQFPIEIQAESLDELIEEISQARLVIATDTGPLQMAIALGVPTLGLFGGSDENIIVNGFERYVRMNNVKILRSMKDDACRRPCNFVAANGFGGMLGGRNTKCKYEADCMFEIEPQEIIKQAKQMLA